MLKPYYPSTYSSYDLLRYNIRYISTLENSSEPLAIFIAQYDYYTKIISNIETFSFDSGNLVVSRDLIKFYELIDNMNPTCIEFTQDDDEYNYKLMLKIAKKFDYDVYMDKKNNKYKLFKSG